ncbi:MAG: hypothetical protein A2052_00160 [Deltaproteobacteria bacterium GWA2_54_12]|nr:MAG: hypothetical protein A2052_00160 [Deltaproteobacteria bacterium GWA2_54_12]
MRKVVLFLFAAILSGCAGVNFSQVNPEAKDFHPKTIAVMPATVGEYESSRDIIEQVISSSLLKTGYFENVIDSTSIKTQVAGSTELANDVSSFIQKLNTIGVADTQAAARIKTTVNTEALFLTYVTSWGYGRSEGNKVARVGLGVKLVNAENGQLVWKANHEVTEDYTIMKPNLSNMAKDVMSVLIKEMPR